MDLDYTPLKHFSNRLTELAALNDVPADLAAAGVGITTAGQVARSIS